MSPATPKPAPSQATAPMPQGLDPARLRLLTELERKVLWLSSWTIHNANHLRPSRDGLKVGGHQASSASVATLMTALYFDVLRPQDRVAVKPHASPVFHAIQYLLGQQKLEKLQNFRASRSSRNAPSFAVALNWGIGSSSLKADVNALDRLHRVRGRKSSYCGSKYKSCTRRARCFGTSSSLSINAS